MKALASVISLVALVSLVSPGCRTVDTAVGEVLGTCGTERCTTRLAPLPADAERVRLWIPIPANSASQEVAEVRIWGTSGNQAFELRPEAFREDGFSREEGGVTFTLADVDGLDARSLCVETAGRPIDVEMRCTVTRFDQGEDAEVATGPLRLAPPPARGELTSFRTAYAEVDGKPWAVIVSSGFELERP